LSSGSSLAVVVVLPEMEKSFKSRDAASTGPPLPRAAPSGSCGRSGCGASGTVSNTLLGGATGIVLADGKEDEESEPPEPITVDVSKATLLGAAAGGAGRTTAAGGGGRTTLGAGEPGGGGVNVGLALPLPRTLGGGPGGLRGRCPGGGGFPLPDMALTWELSFTSQ